MSRPATDRMKHNPPLGTLPVLQYVLPAQLTIDASYQRTLDTAASQALIRQIAQHWDWDLCLPLVVSRRADGSLYVIDGQHRLAAARIRGDIVQLPAVVGSYASTADEAANFVHLNQQRRPLGKLDLFKAAVASGDTEATEIVAALDAAGLSVAPHMNPISWAPGALANIGGIQASWRRHGPDVTRLALRALREGFDGQVLHYAGSIFPGVAAVVSAEARQFRPAFTDKSWAALIAMIRSRTQDEWRSAMLMARAHDPNLTFPKASEKVLLDAWDADADTLITPAASAPAPAASTAKPSAPPPPAPPSTARTGRPTIPTGLFSKGKNTVAPVATPKAAPAKPTGGAPKAAPAKPAAVAPTQSVSGTAGASSGLRRFIPGADQKAWCSQCDRRVGAAEFFNCKDAFCSFKREPR